MFLLAILSLIIIVCFILFFVVTISSEKQSIKSISTPIRYRLNQGVDTSHLTQKQLAVVEYLQNHGTSKEKTILNRLNISRSVLHALMSQSVIEKTGTGNLNQRSILIAVAMVVLLALAMVAADYYFLVKLNFRYYGIIFYIFLFVILAYNIYAKQTEKKVNDKIRTNSFIFLGTILIVIILGLFGGRPYLNAKAYSELISVGEADFVNDIQTVNVDTLPLVDKAYGYKLGQLKLGEYPGIGSEFEAGEYSDIIYQGKQYLVAPLEYRDVFKWLSNRKTGTPGYILIDKVTAETTLVNLLEDSGEGLLITPSAFLNQDLVRYAYYNGMSKYKLENQFFEIDETGHPYYVLQYSLPSIFINGGPKINKIAVVNALNGEINIYSPGEEPEWVESVYPNTLLFDQLNYWGSLKDGWLNSIFAQKGVLQASSGTRVIMNEDELYYFTGLTSAGNDESTIGFVYMGLKTKETKLFRFPGATEEAAMNKVITLLPQNNISTSFPIPINVEDVPTYFILIKGADGRILRYVYVSVQDLELYSMSENKSTAYSNYLIKLSESSTDAAEQVSGVITDIVSYVSGGNTIYWIELDNDLRYKINVSNFSDAKMGYFTGLDIGDTISISVMDYNVVDIEIE